MLQYNTTANCVRHIISVMACRMVC